MPFSPNSLIGKMPYYNQWANDQLRRILYQVPTHKFTQDLGTLFVNDLDDAHSCLNSLVKHTMMGFYFNIALMTQTDFEAPKIFSRLGEMDQKTLLKEWGRLDQEYLSLFPKLFNRTVMFKDKPITLDSDYLFVFLNHSTHHRAQLMVALRMVGEKGCDTDYMSFIQSFEKEQ